MKFAGRDSTFVGVALCGHPVSFASALSQKGVATELSQKGVATECHPYNVFDEETRSGAGSGASCRQSEFPCPRHGIHCPRHLRIALIEDLKR
jgi:hypothetical protein